jgi:beta-lactamase class A
MQFRVWFVFALGFTAIVAAQPLEQKLRARIGDFPGTVSLYAKNLHSGVAVGIRESEPVRTASTIKLPIMLAVFDAVARGRAQWTELLTVTAAEKVDGTGIIDSELSNGVQLPLRDVVHLMIVISDNTATNMILERFTADAVNAYLDKIGIQTTRALRKMSREGSPTRLSAAGKLPQNQKYGLGVSTPRDMTRILEKLERGEIVSPEASREMVGILKRCRDDWGIRRRLHGVPVANKTGYNESFRSDVGIAYSAGGPIAMAISVTGIPEVDFTPDNVGSLLIADLAKILVDELSSNSRRQ